MNSSGIDASTLNAFADQLESKSTAAEFLVRGAVRKTTQDIAADAKANAPVDTGNLRNSIQTSSAGSNAQVAQGVIQARADYSKFVEFGTSRQAPQPFLGPAGDKHLPKLQEAVGQVIGKLVEGL